MTAIRKNKFDKIYRKRFSLWESFCDFLYFQHVKVNGKVSAYYCDSGFNLSF